MLIPRPTRLETGEGDFELDRSTRIHAPIELAQVGAWLQSALRPATGLPLLQGDDGDIRLEWTPELSPEEYRISVTRTGVHIAGGGPAGAFYGCQTLLQLLPAQIYRRSQVAGVPWRIPVVEIEDAPRFGWRGVMLDTARHFLPKREILRYIDLLAMHRLNVLHLHLTDDQGWRVQIDRYPRLTEVGAWRAESQVGAGPDAMMDGRPHGGFYTQDDLREIVAYAAERFITVVPEIETPGHAQAAIAAYPELGVTGEPLPVWTHWGVDPNVLNVEESTIEFFTGVLDEVMAIFPSPYIGVGGDECPKEQWRQDARTQERMRELGIETEDELQSWFIHRLDEHLTARGRRLFGWDEILEGGLAPGATVASWRGNAGAIAAARAGHDVVSCPDDRAYFDYRQSDLPDEPIPVAIVLTTSDVFRFDPVPSGLSREEAQHVLGGQANIWTEHMDSPRTIDYFAFPRLCALAEALWCTGERDFDDFTWRLDLHLAKLDALGVEYRKASGPLPWQTRPGVPGRPSTREERDADIAQLTAGIASTTAPPALEGPGSAPALEPPTTGLEAAAVEDGAHEDETTGDGSDALRRLVATTLMPGFLGTTLPEWLKRRLEDGLGAVCLFGPNIASPEQLRELTAAILAANPDAVIAIDEEGGDVTRLHHATGSPYPGNAILGRIDDTALTQEVGARIGWELRDAGCTLTFAPDADVNSNPDNPVIGVRSFGSEAESAARHASAWIRGAQSTGIAACAKHFPGHGDTAQDSHLALPVIQASRQELVERELVPFRAAIDAGTRTIMTSHILVPQVDAEQPSTFSRGILEGLLRDELGFTGVIVTDALDMKGASGARGIPSAAVAAIAAGCDLLCLGTATTEELLGEVEEAVLRAVSDGDLDAERLRQAADRVLDMARGDAAQRAAMPAPDSLPAEGLVLPERVAAAFDGGPAARSWIADQIADYAVVEIETTANIAVGPAPWGPFAAAEAAAGPLAARFAARPRCVVSAEHDGAADLAPDAPVLVVGKAIHRYPFACEAVDRLRARHARVLVVDMGWPAPDRRYADLATFGASLLAGEALLRVLAGELPLG